MFSKTNAELQQAILLHSTSKDLKFKQLDHGFGTKDENTQNISKVIYSSQSNNSSSNNLKNTKFILTLKYDETLC